MDNFRNGLLGASGTIFAAGERKTENHVNDTHFTDPDYSTGSSSDNDTHTFDQAGNGLAYVALHGSCNDETTQGCTSTSGCTTPGSGQTLPGSCISNGPGVLFGWCAYNTDRLLINNATAPLNINFGQTDYTGAQSIWGDRGAKWGETSSSGSWAGASTNGGINLGLLSNSCGVRPGFVWDELQPLFAGMTVLGIVMPVTPRGADDWDAPARGTAFANAYVTNSGGVVGTAWADSISGIPYNDGPDCPNLGSSYSTGGGHGIGGCGAQMAVSVDVNSSDADWDLYTQSWGSIINSANGATGGNNEDWFYVCNYDCNKYPFTL